MKQSLKRKEKTEPQSDSGNTTEDSFVSEKFKKRNIRQKDNKMIEVIVEGNQILLCALENMNTTKEMELNFKKEELEVRRMEAETTRKKVESDLEIQRAQSKQMQDLVQILIKKF